MTGTEMAKTIHNAIAGLAEAYGRALEMVATETSVLRGRVDEMTKMLANAAKERAEVVEALPPGNGTLASRIKELGKAWALPDGYRNHSCARGEGTSHGEESWAWVVLNDKDPMKDGIVLHLTIDQASRLHEIMRQRSNSGDAVAPFRALSAALDNWKSVAR